MSTTPNPVPPDFSSLAPFYRWMEMASFGPFLQRCRCAFINALADRRHALVLGDGDGRFTARLLRANSQIQIEAVDASLAMLDELRRRAIPSANRVRTTCADARYWQPASPPYDLVVTHFFLDCLTTAEVQSLANKMRAAVAPNAQWLISEFASSRRLVWQVHRASTSAHSLLGFRLAHRTQSPRTCPTIELPCAEPASNLLQERRWLGGLLVSELWQVNLPARDRHGRYPLSHGFSSSGLPARRISNQRRR